MAIISVNYEDYVNNMHSEIMNAVTEFVGRLIASGSIDLREMDEDQVWAYNKLIRTEKEIFETAKSMAVLADEREKYLIENTNELEKKVDQISRDTEEIIARLKDLKDEKKKDRDSKS